MDLSTHTHGLVDLLSRCLSMGWRCSNVPGHGPMPPTGGQGAVGSMSLVIQEGVEK